jgi:hypothetical protein
MWREGQKALVQYACALASSRYMPLLLLLSRKSCSLPAYSMPACVAQVPTTCTTGLDVPGVGV